MARKPYIPPPRPKSAAVIAALAAARVKNDRYAAREAHARAQSISIPKG